MIGTPHERCRLMHQSGRDSTAPRMRASPHAGIQPWLAAIFLTSSRAMPRGEVVAGLVEAGPGSAAEANALVATPATSSPTNHWSTARKMIGVSERQQCG